jgi:hypothetical protein
MNLEERMEFRREMLYEAIRITLQAHGILSASYRFRVVRNDRRGHMYSVMMDLSTDFMHNREGRPAQLVALGMAIGKNAAARYGILVSGVYWRVNDEIQGFEPSRPDAEPGADATAPDLPPPRPPHERARAEAPGRTARNCGCTTAFMRPILRRSVMTRQEATARASTATVGAKARFHVSIFSGCGTRATLNKSLSWPGTCVKKHIAHGGRK